MQRFGFGFRDRDTGNHIWGKMDSLGVPIQSALKGKAPSEDACHARYVTGDQRSEEPRTTS
jgi:hypothetical protein